MYVFVQSLQDVRSLQDVLFRPRKSGASVVMFAYRVRSDVSAVVAETRADSRLEIKFKPRMVVVQRTKRGIRFFNMIESLSIDVFQLSFSESFLKIAKPGVFGFHCTHAR